MNDKTIQELREKVFTAIGEASMCWIPTPKGIFDSTRAEKVGKALVDEILSRAEQEAKEEPLEKVPHIICLAAAHHYRLRPAMTAKEWVISLVKIGDRNTKFVAHGETYWEAESKARAYLSSLPDVKGDK